MKAKDYFEKYESDMMAIHLLDIDAATPEQRRDVVQRLETAVRDCSNEMFMEINVIAKQRKTTIPDRVMSIVDEVNKKWNALCRLFEKKYDGTCPIKHDVILQMYKDLGWQYSWSRM